MTLTIGEVIQKTSAYFQQKGIDSARLDAELLLAHVLQATRVELYVNYDRPLSTAEVAAYRELIARRGQREPLAYITGHKEFYGLDFTVTPAVLIPRPETELLVEAVLAYLEDNALTGNSTPSIIVEIGMGSGAIAVALAAHCPDVEIYGTDISLPALEVAAQNVGKHGYGQRVHLCSGPYFTGVPSELRGQVRVVVSNPPYLTRSEMAEAQPELHREPSLALDGGEDGLAVYRQLVTEAADWLAPGGLLALEIGSGQGPALIDIINATGVFTPPEIRSDYAGHDRVVMTFSCKG